MYSPAALNPENSTRSAPTGLAGSAEAALRRKPQLVTRDGTTASARLAAFGRNWWQRRAGEHRAARGCGRNVLIVGAGPLGREMAAILKRDHADGRNVLGFLDEDALVMDDVLGRLEDLARIAREEFVDEIILAIPDQPATTRRVVREARRNRLDIRVIPDCYDGSREGEGRHETRPLVLEFFGDLPVLRVHEERRSSAGLFCKRAVDIAVSTAALLLAAPLLVMISLAIRVASPGRVLYRAERVGLKGRRFVCYKFRTMVAGADRLKDSLRGSNERSGPCFKIADDPRITCLGRILRRYSLDELPQFWNVLRGEMSLVGPRPHPLDDFEHYRLDHLRRLDVTPGITGLWQVTARHDPSFQRNMALDLEYIERWNFWMDLRILLKTALVILHGRGV